MIHKKNNKNNNQGVFLELLVAAKKVSTPVQSQAKLMPPLKGETVILSGRGPSPLSNPGGSKTDGILKRSLNHSTLCVTGLEKEDTK